MQNADAFTDGNPPVELPIDGELDLHTFQPREIKDLVPDYLAACRQRGILQVRIIHGKGIGNLRRTVHSLLSRNRDVLSYTLDYPQFGGWVPRSLPCAPMTALSSVSARLARFLPSGVAQKMPVSSPGGSPASGLF